MEAGHAGGEEDIVVTVPIDAAVVTANSAAIAAVLEDVEEVPTVEAVGSPGQDLALPDAIGDGEAGGDLAVVANIAELMDLDKDDQPGA